MPKLLLTQFHLTAFVLHIRLLAYLWNYDYFFLTFNVNLKFACMLLLEFRSARPQAHEQIAYYLPLVHRSLIPNTLTLLDFKTPNGFSSKFYHWKDSKVHLE